MTRNTSPSGTGCSTGWGEGSTYASAGHPPALLLSGPTPDRARPIELGLSSLAIGMIRECRSSLRRVPLEPYSKLYVFSDGVYEIHKPGGAMMRRGELMDYLASSPRPTGPDEVWRYIQEVGGDEALQDDFSLLEIVFAA